MKSLYLVPIILTLIVSSFCCAEQEEPSPSPVTPIKELKVESLDFENLPKESQIGDLSELVNEEKSLASSLMDRIHQRLILHPYAETLAYVNGQLCHVGNYSQSVIYTVLDGPYYGTQTTVDYNGVVLYVNYDYKLKYTPEGVIFHHYYSDSKIVTGSNQVVIFH